MTILSDNEIMTEAMEGMIVPYVIRQVKEADGFPVISYGQSSFGYDIRLGEQVMLFYKHYGSDIDPKDFDRDALIHAGVYADENNGRYAIIPPHSFALGSTVERFAIPRDVMVVFVGKSTYARCGLIVNVTPAEPGWEGHLTLELHNTTPLPLRVYLGEGIAQALFFRGEACRVSYADRGGKYQGQRSGVVTARV
jgi:dCTP deaminase